MRRRTQGFGRFPCLFCLPKYWMPFTLNRALYCRAPLLRLECIEKILVVVDIILLHLLVHAIIFTIYPYSCGLCKDTLSFFPSPAGCVGDLQFSSLLRLCIFLISSLHWRVVPVLSFSHPGGLCRGSRTFLFFLFSFHFVLPGVCPL